MRQPSRRCWRVPVRSCLLPSPSGGYSIPASHWPAARGRRACNPRESALLAGGCPEGNSSALPVCRRGLIDLPHRVVDGEVQYGSTKHVLLSSEEIDSMFAVAVVV